MKKIAGLVVIIAALVLVGYYGMGIVTERTVKHNLEAVNRSNGLFVKVVNYNRGWFKSTALLEWRLHVPERIAKNASGQPETVPAQDFEMQMPVTIYHGPIIFARNTLKFGMGYANTDIPMPEKYAPDFNNLFTQESTRPKLNLNMFVNYLNNSQVELSIPPFKLIGKQGGQFDWKGMTSAVDVTSDASKIKGELTLDGIQFNKDDNNAVLGEITADYDLHKNSGGLYLGDASMSLPSILVTQKNRKIFELSDLDMHSNCDVENGLFSSHFKSSIDKIFAHDKTYGPANLEMSFKNLDADVLASINQKVKQAQQGTDAQRQQSLLAILPDVPKLFSRGAEFEISELSFVMPEGVLEGDLMINLPEGNSGNPFELVQKVKGKGKLKVPAGVVNLILDESNQQKLLAAANQQTQQSATMTLPASGTTTTTTTTTTVTTPAAVPDVKQQAATMTQTQLAAMVQSGLIVQAGNYYVVEVVLDQGKLQINGKPFNPAMIKF